MHTKVPPIKSQGIKTKLVPWILEALEWHGQGTWIEPFMGTGVVGFNVMPKKALFCDTNPHIIRFYSALQTHKITPRAARLFLEAEGAKLENEGGEYYYKVRERFNSNHEPLDFLFLNRSCFNGMMRFNRKGKFNVPWGHKPKRFAKAYVTKIVNQIDWVQKLIDSATYEFVVCDFQQAVEQATENDFIYCDPPYIGRHTDYFNSWDETHETRLHDCLSAAPCKFLLSTWHSNKYRSNKYVSSIWADFDILTREHFYHVGASEKNRNSMKEAVIANYRTFIIEKAQVTQLRLLENKGIYVTEG